MDSNEELAEVVQDFREALEDLHDNSKPAIDVLTIIAKENTDFAQSISNVLENHIKTTRPEWRLPALLVLDSLIRHVGPPYSTYLARNLYDTFMEVYRHNGERVRQELEMILGTWKHPPQGSRDPRPVLPIEVTGVIENAVMRFRSIATQFAPQQYRQIAHPVVHNHVTHNHHHPHPNPHPHPHSHPNNFNGVDMIKSYHQRSVTPTYPVAIPPVIHSPQNHANLYKPPNQGLNNFSPPPLLRQSDLQNEVREVLKEANIKSMLETDNQDIKQLIDTLESLKTLLDSQSLDDQHLQQMHSELQKLRRRLQSQLSTILGNTTNLSTSTPPPITNNSTSQIQPNRPPVDIASILNVLQPSYSSNSISSIPQAAQPLQQPQQQQHLQQQQQQQQQPSLIDNPLLAQLRAAGLLSSTSTPTSMSIPLPMPMPTSSGDQLNQDSIRIRRPELMKNLINRFPDQCRQCGRRFPATEEGKQNKTKHLDWHFSIKSRLADATRTSIVHRSTYLNEQQWYTLRETTDLAEDITTTEVTKVETTTEIPWVSLPSDSALLGQPCPICMEPFQSVWHSKTQQPVWMDTVKVGGKYYHASCYEDLHGKGSLKSVTITRTSTPDSILGKRKFGRV